MYEALFISTVINEKGGVVSRVPYIDPTVSIFSHKHMYLISFSIFILVLIILPPLLLLIVFPTRLFQKVSRYLKPRWIVSMQTFVDQFHSCYKDGTNGTSDYRAVSGYILAILTFVPAVYVTTRALAIRNQFIIFIIILLQCCLDTLQTQKCQHFWSDSTCYLLFSNRFINFIPRG